MTTKALNTLVIPTLKSLLFPYDILDMRQAISFQVALTEAIDWLVIDHTQQQFLSLEARHIVTVPPEVTIIQAWINERNAAGIGKFSLSHDILRYRIELAYIAETPPAAFQHTLFLAFDAVTINYHNWQQAMKENSLQTFAEKIRATIR